MPTKLDLTGVRFGRWIVVAPEPSHDDRTFWTCRCDCGSVRIVSTQTLRMHLSQSCGCLRANVSSVVNRTHGATNTTEYRAWCGIKKRCYNHATKSYADYGARGIVVCDRWRDSFETFYTDMGQCPPGHSIERIDNDGPYAPDNCKWASRKEQNSNTRRNVYVTWLNQQMTVSEAARMAGIKRLVLHKRLARGWSIDRAMTEPLHR